MKPVRVSVAERAWVGWFAAALAAFTSLPYLLAFARGAQTFTGFLIGVEDGNSYIAKMLLGANGDWLFRSPYSIEPQTGALLYLPYQLLGKLLGPMASHIAFVLAFHAFRIASLVALCFAIYFFISAFVKRIDLRRLGLALATLGGGLGWLVLLAGRSEWLGSMPLDFYSPETFGYLALFALPHLALARALLLLAFLQYLGALPARPAVVIVTWLSLALTHLITAGLGLGLIGLHVLASLFRPRTQAALWRYLLWAALGAAPVLLFDAYVFWQDAYLQAWAAQNQILSPHPLHYLLAYGLLLPFASLGLRKWKEDALKLFCLIWSLALPVLLYLPLGLQRRFSEAAWVLLIALALRAFDERIVSEGRRWLFALALPTTLILWFGAMQAAWAAQLPVQRTADEVAVYIALKDQAEAGQVVLAAYSSSNALPAWAPLRVVAGHGPESVHFERYAEDVSAFYQAATPESARIRILRRNHVDYVLWGPAERAIGQWDPTQADYLTTWFGVGSVQVFRVVLPLE